MTTGGDVHRHHVLVYALVRGASNRDQASRALGRHAASGETLSVSRQVLREFLATITRPQAWARATAIDRAMAVTEAVSAEFDVLEDGPLVWDRLADLCRRFQFGGRSVHDANIVATMLAHGEQRLLTFNQSDFRRFAGLIEIEPLPAT